MNAILLPSGAWSAWGPLHPPAAGQQFCLQFVIHSTFVLVTAKTLYTLHHGLLTWPK